MSESVVVVVCTNVPCFGKGRLNKAATLAKAHAVVRSHHLYV